MDENDAVYCIHVGAEESAGRPASEFQSNLEQWSEMCMKCKIETVSFYVLDFRLASVDFAVLYEHILSLLVQQGVKRNYIQKQVVYLTEPLTVAELTLSITGLSGLCSSTLTEVFSDFPRSVNYYRCKVTKKPIGYHIRFRLPRDLKLDLDDVETDLGWHQEDFITDNVNPVVCNPADFSLKGSLTKAFLREYKAQQDLFNQKAGPSGVARIKPMTDRTSMFLFLCVTRITVMEKTTPEVFYRCLCVVLKRFCFWRKYRYFIISFN